MPRYIPSLPFEDCYGSVGEKTYYHRNGICYYKKRARPVFPGTMLQMEHQTVHLRAIAAWQGLEPSVQKEWPGTDLRSNRGCRWSDSGK